MRDKLHTLLGIESGEESMVSMLLTQSVFLGIFIGAFDITAHSLLLSTFDEKIMARGYIVSAIAGIILTSVYSHYQTRVQFRNLAIINLTSVSLLTVFLWCALILIQVKWIIFIVFIMLGPLNLITLFVFWGTAEQLSVGRQVKGLYRFADTGLIIGIILISFLVPVLMSFKFQSHNILLVSASSVIIATLIQMVIGSKFIIVAGKREQFSEKSEKKSLLRVFREDSYIRSIAIFAALSVLTAFFIQYSFMAVTRVQYPVAEDLAGFLGLFTGCLMIFILLIKLVIFPYVLHNYGLRTCLLIAPALIAVFTAISIATGLLMDYATVATDGFLIFFLLLAFSRIISKSLKESVEFPSLKVIFQPINKETNSELQAGIAGIINEVSVFFSGLLLTAIGLLSFVKIIHFSLFLFFISLIWFLVALRLFKEYRKSIKKATETAGWEGSVVEISNNQNNFKNRFSAYLDFRSDYFRLISGDYSVLNKIRTKWYFEEIIEHAYLKKDLTLLPVLKKTANNVSLDEEVRQHSAEVLEILQKDSTSLNSDSEKLSGAIKLLSGTRMPQTTEILRLLRDNSIDSKRLAIYMIGKFHLTDLLSAICECLIIPDLTKDAYEVLKAFGSDAEDELIRFFLITSGNIKLSKTILQLLGNTCTKETLGFLFSRLWSNSRQLKEIAVKSLIDCKFKPSEEEKQRLHQLTSEVIGSITWNLSAKVALERDKDNFLLERINLEILRWDKFLFSILSITYNSESIARIKENISQGSFESVNYALDMADILVSDSVKPKLISLLDFVPDEDKLKTLFQFYPGEIPLRKKLLEDIINRDYNLISLWTKACTLRSITKIECDDMAESVTALLFSPEELIQEEAVTLIARSKPELYISASPRIPDLIKTRLDKIINGTTDNKELLFEKVKFLAKYFMGISEDELLLLASQMRYLKNFDRESLRYSEGCIIWPLNGDNGSNEVHVVYDGEMERLSRKYQDEQHLSFYFLPLIAVEEYNFQFPDKSYEILKYIDNNEEY